MTLKRLHTRMAKFSDSAEALADFALATPVVDAKDVGLNEKKWEGSTCSSAFTITKRRVEGFSKTTEHESAARHVYMAMLATTLGAPSAPYVMIKDCAKAKRRNRTSHDMNMRMFSAVPFKKYREQEYALLPGPVSAGAAGQFRSFIHDIDYFDINHVHCCSTKDISLYDHERARPEKSFTEVDDENKLMIIVHWNDMHPVHRGSYAESACEMARRIATCPDAILDGIAENMIMSGLPVQPDMVVGLKSRRTLFKQPVVLDTLAS